MDVPDNDAVHALNSLTDKINQLVTKLDSLPNSSNTQTVVHKTAGMGSWAVAAVVACFFTFLGLILFAMVIIPDVHDLRAWQDIMRQKIAKLEGQVNPQIPRN